MTRGVALVALVAAGAAGCNAVLGLGEGKVLGDDDGEGGASATRSTSAQADTSSSSVAPSTTSSQVTSTASTASDASTASVGSSATGSACVLTTGLANGDFTVWSFDSPDRWNEFANGPDVVTTELADGAGGLRMVVSGSNDVDDYGGTYQSGSILPAFTQCIELRGASRKASGTGRLSVTATLAGNRIAMDLPNSGQITPFARSCRLITEANAYEIRIMVDQMGGDPGDPGGATVEIPSIALDHICCDGVVDMCEPEP